MKQAGSVTIDFIFGIVMVAGVSSILLAFCFTMAVVEVSQYISFASSRAYFSAHLDQETQVNRAQAKFDNILANRSLRKILRGDWFTLSYLGTGDFRGVYQPHSFEHDNDTFFGNRLELNAKVLEIIPLFKNLLGATESNDYKANIGSYLGREPTFSECMTFVKQRWTNFNAKYPLLNTNIQGGDEAYVPIADNGC